MTALMPEYDTTDSIPVFAPREPVRLPRDNLQPPEIIEKRAVARLGQRLAGVVLIAALIGAAVGYEAGAGHDSAQQRLDAAQTQGSRLQAERARLAPAQQALTAAQQAQQTLKAAMAQEVLWSRYLEEVKLKLPKTTRLSNMVLGSSTAATGSASSGSATTPRTGTSATTGSTAGSTGTGSTGGTAGTPGAAGAAGATAADAAISSATFTGTAESQYAVADWLQNMTTIPGFSGPYLSSTAPAAAAGGSKLVTFTVTVDVTAAALSHRYDDVAGG